MIRFCPVSDRLVNEYVSRLNAFFSLVFASGFLFSGNYWFLIILSLDFALRLLNKGKYSPIIRLNKLIVSKLNLSEKKINAGPKIFAGRIGLTLSILSLLLLIFSFKSAAFTVIFLLGLFALLEFALGLCIACKIYPYALYINNINFFR